MGNFTRDLEQLKLTLINEDNFEKTQNAFFDLAEKPGFISEGKETRNPELKKYLDRLAEKFLGKDATAAKTSPLLILKEIKAEKFIHGMYILQNGSLTFFYFKDLDMGLSTCSNDDAIDLDLARFSIVRSTSLSTPTIDTTKSSH